MGTTSRRATAILLVGFVVSVWHLPAMGQGRTGEPTKDDAAVEQDRHTRYTEADVRFMQGMIRHHEQALEMSSLVPERTTSERVRLLAERIKVSQKDEIDLMRRWLAERSEAVPAPRRDGHGHDERPRDHDERHGDEGDHHDAHHGDEGDHHDAHHGEGGEHHDDGGEHHAARPGDRHHHGHLMPGMLMSDEMARLAASTGEEFDRLFLEFMIFHHEGALVMVDELFSSPGAAQEPEIFRIASDVDADQRAEIRRMLALLDALAPQTSHP